MPIYSNIQKQLIREKEDTIIEVKRLNWKEKENYDATNPDTSLKLAQLLQIANNHKYLKILYKDLKELKYNFQNSKNTTKDHMLKPNKPSVITIDDSDSDTSTSLITSDTHEQITKETSGNNHEKDNIAIKYYFYNRSYWCIEYNEYTPLRLFKLYGKPPVAKDIIPENMFIPHESNLYDKVINNFRKDLIKRENELVKTQNYKG